MTLLKGIIIALLAMTFFYNQHAFAVQMKWERCVTLLQVLGERTIKLEDDKFNYEAANQSTNEAIAAYGDFQSSYWPPELVVGLGKIREQIPLAPQQINAFPSIDTARYPIFGFVIKGAKAIEDLKLEMQSVANEMSSHKDLTSTDINLGVFLFLTVYLPHLITRISPNNSFPLWSYPIVLAYYNFGLNLFTFVRRMDWPMDNFTKFTSPVIEKKIPWKHQSSHFEVLGGLFRAALLAKVKNPSGEPDAEIVRQGHYYYRKESKRDTFGPLLRSFSPKQDVLKMYMDEIIYIDVHTNEPDYVVLIRGLDH